MSLRYAVAAISSTMHLCWFETLKSNMCVTADAPVCLAKHEHSAHKTEQDNKAPVPSNEPTAQVKPLISFVSCWLVNVIDRGRCMFPEARRQKFLQIHVNERIQTRALSPSPPFHSLGSLASANELVHLNLTLQRPLGRVGRQLAN